MLVLSLFPGIGLFDRAFEEEGFTVVRQARELYGWDQAELAQRLQCHIGVVKRMESDTTPPSDMLFGTMCLVLGFPPAFFQQGDPPELPLGSLVLHED